MMNPCALDGVKKRPISAVNAVQQARRHRISAHLLNGTLFFYISIHAVIRWLEPLRLYHYRM